MRQTGGFPGEFASFRQGASLWFAPIRRANSGNGPTFRLRWRLVLGMAPWFSGDRSTQPPLVSIRISDSASHRRSRFQGRTGVYVSCSTLCFSKLPLDDALKTIRDLRFAKVDLAIHAPGPHLRPVDIVPDPTRISQRLKSANIPFGAFHAEFGDATPTEQTKQLRAICRLARLMAVPVVTVPVAPLGADFDQETERIAVWCEIAASDGVILSVETHSETITADPAGALELCKRVPGLGLTLDPSHYLIGPHAGVDYDDLFPYVRHVMMRDTAPGAGGFQVRVGQGHTEFGRVVSQLERFRFDRALTVDIRDVPDNSFPVEPEVRKLKYLLESLV